MAYDFLECVRMERNSKVHLLKTVNPYFQLIHDEVKSFELRSTSDRDFREGDTLVLYEWEDDKCTGRAIITQPVHYILKDYVLMLPNTCILEFILDYKINNFCLEFNNGVPITTIQN